MWTNLMSPIIDLYKTGISKIDKIDLKFIKIVLNEHETIDFLTTSISKKDTSRDRLLWMGLIN